MILKSNIRGHPSQLTSYLLNRKNDQEVQVFGIHGTSQTKDLKMALVEMNLGVELSGRTKKGLYQVIINPRPDESRTMTDSQWMQCVNVIEQVRGFSGQPKVMVFHTNSRKHLHVIWSRWCSKNNRILSNQYSHYQEKKARMMIEKELGHAQTQETNLERPKLKKILTELWAQHPNGKSFVNAAKELGYIIARQEGRRPYAIINSVGRSFELAKETPARIKQIRERLKGLQLPDKNEVIKTIRQQQANRKSKSREIIATALKQRPKSDLSNEKDNGR